MNQTATQENDDKAVLVAALIECSALAERIRLGHLGGLWASDLAADIESKIRAILSQVQA